MPSRDVIAGRYAKAFFRVARDRDALESSGAALAAAAEAVCGYPDICLFWANPFVSLAEKRRVLQTGLDSLEPDCPDHCVSFLNVLLKNDRGLLPLDPAKIKKLALIGPFAGELNLAGTSSSMLFPPYKVTPEDGIRKLAPDADIILDKGKIPLKAAGLARDADAAIVFVGLTKWDEQENMDRWRMPLSRDHETLIRAVARANKNTIVVLSTGSALVTERWVDCRSVHPRKRS